MVISFFFCASSSHLDVIAGAAGFVAGSVLAGAGLVSVILLRYPGLVRSGEDSAGESSVFGVGVDVHHWLTHFERNQENRVEPDWNAPQTIPAEAVRPLVRSLEQFQLGDGGGPACLIAWNAEQFRSSSEGMGRLVDLWFTEEREHARLLGEAVTRFGGRCIQWHWSFATFCMVRKWLGVRFELTVLLLTEIVSTVYYRLLRRHGQDRALRSMCRLILRDEAGHIAFHRDRLARAARAGLVSHGPLWEGRFRMLGLAAATMLWINHAPGLKALGASRKEFYREVWMELTRFIRRLREQS
jgi:hypothetical protein